jgi:hypothetical protein
MDNGTGTKISKKKAKALVYDKIAGALAEYQGKLKPKRFEAKLKKASKLFAADIAKATTMRQASKKKTPKSKVPANTGATQKDNRS